LASRFSIRVARAMLLRLIEKEGTSMMSLKRSGLSVLSGFSALLLTMAACGSDERELDVRAFIPKPALPAARVAVSDGVATAPPLAVAKVAVPTTFDAAMLQGKGHAERGEVADATRMFDAAAKLDPQRPEPHLELARLYISSGQRGLAMAAANKAVKLAPLSSQAWNTKGRAELNRFAYDDAIEAFTKAVELNHENVWAWNNLGYTELQLQKYDEAAEHLGEAVTKVGATGYMFNNLGTALEHLDRLDAARAAFEGGAKLGSREAVASRKRLEGVTSIAIAERPSKPDLRPEAAQTYDTNEGPAAPEGAPDDDQPADAPATRIEDPEIDLSTPDESNTRAPLGAPKADAGVPTV
jgi:tetratricopeptide (TPR) repeat protein